MSKEKVPIVIVSHDRYDLLDDCLRSIRENTYYPYELILVDNGSDKRTEKYIQQQYNEQDDVKIVYRFDENVGFANGYGEGLNLIDAKYQVLVNNDTIVYPYWLTKIIDVFEKHSRAGIVMPYTNYGCNREIICGIDNYREKYTKLINGNAPAVCWAVKKECHQKVCEIIEALDGGHQFFHKDFEYGWSEDMLTSVIVRKIGFQQYVAGGSFIFHKGNGTQQILKNEGVDVAGYRRKNQGMLAKCLEYLEYVFGEKND